VDYKDNAGLSALNWAALRRRNQVAAQLLLGNADVNTQDNKGVTPLLYAAGTHNIELLKLLVTEGAELEVESKANLMTPLLVTVETGDVETMLALLELGAKVDGPNHLGYTPLMAAAEGGKLEFVQLLLAGGADVNARDVDGMTALAFAQKNGYTQIETLLKLPPSDDASSPGL
jgi:ankyrin repeat protein